MSSLESAAAIPSDLIWRLSLDRYHSMIKNGILTDEDPVELLEGWLVFKRPKNPPHRAATRLVRIAIESILPSGWYVDSQEPIALFDSEPEPDVVVVRGDTRQYLARHPGAEDIALVVEVADTTLQRDRSLKKRIYARAGIPIYWIVNLLARQIEVYTQPFGEAEHSDYATQQNYGLEDALPLAIEGFEIGTLSVDSLLP
ncbi:Uma2 family endonuclease [Argonema antarcticum]|uniref:Uma2 family endonuclease n=1 Tax=Argonema antarcticum TaxID=2942763 RepID=UPI002013A1A1|nr:Uma2 family endonuclease [Argonema antarcticum]MCL1470784.1 Uma2 family endonuclease [Argonema antarcticum A004/B2]